MGSGIFRLWSWLKILRDDIAILYFAWRHPYTPPFIKGMLMALLAYVVSPIDILPDYMPIVGIVDDATIVPAAVLYVTHLLPQSIKAECERESVRLRKWIPWLVGLFVIILIGWITLAIMGIKYLFS